MTSHQYLPEEAWPTPITSTEPQKINIEFKKGEPIALNDKKMSPVEVIQQLQEIAQPYGIGWEYPTLLLLSALKAPFYPRPPSNLIFRK